MGVLLCILSPLSCSESSSAGTAQGRRWRAEAPGKVQGWGRGRKGIGRADGEAGES